MTAPAQPNPLQHDPQTEKPLKEWIAGLLGGDAAKLTADDAPPLLDLLKDGVLLCQ